LYSLQGVADPETGENIALPATHASLEMRLSLADFELGVVQFYAGQSGNCPCFGEIFFAFIPSLSWQMAAFHR
jgi:hypothetical protein